MFTACFDASGSSHDKPLLVVAGFIAPADAWIDFDVAWRERLQLDGLSYFHMVEFAHSKGPFGLFKGDTLRRNSLLGDLMQIINGHASRKFGCVVVDKHLQKIPADLKKSFNLAHFALAGRTVAAEVRKWAKSQQISSSVRMVFEDGDFGKGELMEALKHDGFEAPAFEMKKDRLSIEGVFKPAFTPLQASDFLAYEVYVACEKLLRDAFDKARWAIPKFDRFPGEVGLYTEEDLDRLVENLGSHRK